MRRLPLLLLLLSCAQREAERPPAEAAPAPAPAQERSARQLEIYIDHIERTNPVIVKGRARTFENAVSLRLRDAAGTVMAETHVTSVGEMGHHNPYEAQLWLVRDPGNRVTVEAFEYSAKDGSVQSLTRETTPISVGPIRVTLTFPTSDCTKLAQFTRDVPKSPAMARLLIEALIAGPTAAEKAAGATSPFPEGSAVKSVVLREGELTVDFNERLQNVGGSCRAVAIRESVTQTLKELPTVRRVVITAGGREDWALQP